MNKKLWAGVGSAYILLLLGVWLWVSTRQEKAENLDLNEPRGQVLVEFESISPTPTASPTSFPPSDLAIPDGAGLVHAFSGPFVLTAAGEAGLFVRPLADYDAAEAFLALDQPAWDIVVQNETIYVLGCARNCLYIVDLSNLSSLMVRPTIYRTGHFEPVTALTAGRDFLYLAIAGQEIQMVDYQLEKMVHAVPFAPEVSDMVEAEFGMRVLNLAVADDGIYGIHVPDGQPEDAVPIGYQPALRPDWHLPDAGRIEGLLKAGGVLFAAAGERGLRSYTSWVDEALQPNENGQGYLTKIRGETLDAAFREDGFLYVLSETPSGSVITTFLIDVVSNTWGQYKRVDEQVLTGFGSIEKIAWYNGQLWAMSPLLRPITELTPEGQLDLSPPEKYSLIESDLPVVDPPTTTRYVTRLGGNRNVLGRYENIIYVGVGRELLGYELSDSAAPQLIHRQSFTRRLVAMWIDGQTAVLSMAEGYGYQNRLSVSLDLTDPRNPRVGEAGAPHYISDLHVKNGIAFVRDRLSPGLFSMLDLADPALGEITADHPMYQIYEQAAEHLTEAQGVPYTVDWVWFNNFLLYGDLLIINWRDFEGCHLLDCDASLLVFDISDFNNPQMIYGDSRDLTVVYKGFDPAGILTLQAREGEPDEVLDLRPYLPAGILFPEQYDRAFVPSPEEELAVYDFLTGVLPLDLVALGDVGYLLADDGLYVTDLSSLPAVALHQEIPFAQSSTARSMAIQERLLVIQSGSQFDFYDLAAPLSPTLQRTMQYESVDGGWPFFYLTENALIYGADNRLVIEDIAAAKMGEPPPPRAEMAFDGLVTRVLGNVGNHLYLGVEAGRDGAVLLTLDLADLGNPQIVSSQVDIPGASPLPLFFGRSEIRDGYLFFACGYYQICQFDIGTNPADPRFITDTVLSCALQPRQGVPPAVESGVGIEGDPGGRIVWLANAVSEADLLAYEVLGRQLCTPPNGLLFKATIKGDFVFTSQRGSGLLIEQAK